MKRITWLLILGACSGAATGGDPDATTEPDAGGTPRERVGWLDIYEDTQYQSSQVLGQLYDGHGPSFHHVEATSGDCELRQYTPSSCDPACTNGLCVAPDTCEPWPTMVSAGRLTITGLNTPITIDAVAGYYYPQNTLPQNLFDDDAAVHAEFAGAVLPAMSLDAGGVPPLDPGFPDDKITLVPGQDFTIHWTPAGAGRVRVTLNSNNQGHGFPYLGIIECDVPDSAGEVVIPAVLADAFPETQAWSACAGSDCPPSTLRRYRRGAFPIGDDQEVELMVSSQYSFGVDHVLAD